MDTSGRDSRSLAIALAGGHPEASLPCPLCAASVLGRNLASHIERTHAGASVEQRGEGGGPIWRGSDRASRRALIAFAIVVWLTLVLVVGVGGIREDLGVAILVTIGLLAFVPGLLSVAGLLPATVELDGTVLRLRLGLGLVVREVRASAPIETGSLRARRALAALGPGADATGTAPTEDLAAGRYLRVVDGARSITLGCAKGTGLQKHWAPGGWRATGPARSWDITMERTAMVQLEHHLAARGLLAPRAP